MSKAARERSARERLAEQRKRDAAKQKKMRALVTGLGAIVVIAVVVVGYIVIQNGKDAKGGDVALAPQTRQADGSVVMAKAGVEAPVLEIYEDFQCPACQKFEETQGKTIKQLAAEGKVKVVYRPFRLFQQEPLKGNSTRAANALACAPADKWVPFHDKVFAEQPPEGSPGFSNDDLIKWGKENGVSGAAFEKCVKSGEKNAQVDQATAYAEQQKVESTPWVTLNGQKLPDNATFTPDALRKTVESAPKTAPSTPAPSPSASETKKKDEK